MGMKCQSCCKDQGRGEIFWTAPPEAGPDGKRRGAARIVCAECLERITGEAPVSLHELNRRRGEAKRQER